VVIETKNPVVSENLTLSKRKEKKVKESKVIYKENIKEKNQIIINQNNNKIKLFDSLDHETIIKKYEITENELEDEIENFINYWTEPNAK